MCNKAVDDYPNALEFFPECYKTQRMCDKTSNTHTSAIKFVPESFMTQEIRDKAVNSFIYLILFLKCIKLKKSVAKLFLKILVR